MKRLSITAFAALLFGGLSLSAAHAQVGISVGIAPPVLPIVQQPYCPSPGYIWTPGYWAYGPFGYYWVPGSWVQPPSIGLLWTPPYWGWNDGSYVFNNGYWGPTVGFYGGINYGYGYSGNGYYGGRWDGNVFRYNTAVSRVNAQIVRNNVYVDRSALNKQVTGNRASFNGPNGVRTQATAEQKAAAQAQHVSATSQQTAREEAASKNSALRYSENKGDPKATAVNSVQEYGDAGNPGNAKSEKKPANAQKKERATPEKNNERTAKQERAVKENQTPAERSQERAQKNTREHAQESERANATRERSNVAQSSHNRNPATGHQAQAQRGGGQTNGQQKQQQKRKGQGQDRPEGSR